MKNPLLSSESAIVGSVFFSPYDIIIYVIYFRPVLNKDYSWINAVLGLGWGKAFQIVITIIIFLVMYYGFRYCHENMGKNKGIRLIEIFFFAGSLCSLIDKIFWGGSLDYIMLKGLFIFDLKDCYITVFEIGAIMLIIKNWKSLSRVSGKQLVFDYINFIGKSLRR